MEINMSSKQEEENSTNDNQRDLDENEKGRYNAIYNVLTEELDKYIKTIDPTKKSNRVKNGFRTVFNCMNLTSFIDRSRKYEEAKKLLDELKQNHLPQQVKTAEDLQKVVNRLYHAVKTDKFHDELDNPLFATQGRFSSIILKALELLPRQQQQLGERGKWRSNPWNGLLKKK